MPYIINKEKKRLYDIEYRKKNKKRRSLTNKSWYKNTRKELSKQ